MSDWSNCDIRILVSTVLGFAVLIVIITYQVLKMHDRLDRIEKLLKNLPHEQDEINDNN